MFLVGLHLDGDLLRGQGRIATTVSFGATVLPFGFGALLALYLLGAHPTADPLAFTLFLGTAMSVTAFPVLARILTDKGLIDTPIGGLALACAAVGDVVAWALLAVVAALAGGGGEPWRVLLVVPFVAVLLRFVRPLLARLAEHRAASSRMAGTTMLVAVPVGLLLCAAATQWMGLHLIFGAFLFGFVMPRVEVAALHRVALPWIERIGAVVLLPVFFMVAGLKVDLSAVDAVALGELGLILLVAIGGKCLGAFAGARVTGVRVRHSAVLAVLLNTRGLTELIVLTVGLQLAVLDQGLYSLMVLMALTTTAMAGVLLHLIYPEQRVRQDKVARQVVRPSPLPGESAS
jgi:Kef-type K+ transport system membrane component KefB